MNCRIEKDNIGERKILVSNYYGINTRRALENFDLGLKNVNLKHIYEIALIKKSAAMVNQRLKQLTENKAQAIITACEEVIAGNLITNLE